MGELIKAAIDDIGKMLNKLDGKIKDDMEEDTTTKNADDEKDDDINQDEDVMDDMFNTKMKSFWKVANKKHKQLETDFVESQKKLNELGIYLGQKMTPNLNICRIYLNLHKM